MARPRDTQRSKVYKAEKEALKQFSCDQPYKGASVQDCQEYVDRVLRSRWWGARYKQRPHIRVTDGRRHRRAMAYPAWGDLPAGIALPRWARKEWVILHELAHHATDILYGTYGVPSHGREFAKEFHALVKRFIGDEEAKALKEAFKKNRVTFRVTK